MGQEEFCLEDWEQHALCWDFLCNTLIIFSDTIHSSFTSSFKYISGVLQTAERQTGSKRCLFRACNKSVSQGSSPLRSHAVFLQKIAKTLINARGLTTDTRKGAQLCQTGQHRESLFSRARDGSLSVSWGTVSPLSTLTPDLCFTKLPLAVRQIHCVTCLDEVDTELTGNPLG